MILKINFDVFTSKIANLTLWLDISNRESFITIRDFHRDYYSIIKDYINMDLKYIFNDVGLKWIKIVGWTNASLRTVSRIKTSIAFQLIRLLRVYVFRAKSILTSSWDLIIYLSHWNRERRFITGSITWFDLTRCFVLRSWIWRIAL